LLPNRKELTLLLLAIPLRVVKKAVIMHFYKFHIGDYMSHTRHLSHYEDLAYRRLLDFYFLHEQPIKHRDAARHIGMKDHEEDVLTVLNEFFLSTENGFINVRADKEIAEFRKHQAVSAYGAFIRDNPTLKNLVNKEDFIFHYLASSIDVYIGTLRGNDVPIKDTSSGDDAPLTTNHKPLTIIKERATSVAPPEGVSDSVWQEFKTLRKAKKAPITQRAIDAITNEANKAGWTLEKALEECVVRGWQAFKADWVATKANPADIVRLTVPSKNEPDPALEKIKADALKAAPIPLEVLAKMAELRRKA
jgi:uncharacterized protein YdaU (DUF1376 family)